MSSKQLAFLTAAAFALAPLAVSAQTKDVAVYQEAEDDDMMVQPFNLSVDDIEDMDLKTQAGDEIGEVEEVLVDGDGQPVAVAVEVGGFLGMGDHQAVVGLDQLTVMDDDLVTSLDKDAIEALPHWDD
jgi:PRC-barrel domain